MARCVPRPDGAPISQPTVRSFGSKGTVLKKVLATLLGLFGANPLRVIRHPDHCVPVAPLGTPLLVTFRVSARVDADWATWRKSYAGPAIQNRFCSSRIPGHQEFRKKSNKTYRWFNGRQSYWIVRASVFLRFSEGCCAGALGCQHDFPFYTSYF